MFFKKTVAQHQRLIPEIPLGTLKYEVLSEGYRQDTLHKLYRKFKDSPIRFTLTPQCQYQVEHEWPLMPFVNVNLYGSMVTTEENWLGYIRNNYFSEVDLPSIVNKHGPISVYGRITIQGFECQITLLIPPENDTFAASVTYLPSAIPHLKDIAISREEGWAPVQMKKQTTPKGDVYQIFHDSVDIGALSVRKTTELSQWLNGRSIISARFGLYTFREDNPPNHYSKVVITPDIN